MHTDQFRYTHNLKPSMGVQFLHHIFLSMGRFSTDIELKLHGTIRYCFRHVKLIVPDDDITSLENYSYEICARYIKEQLSYFPNAMQTIYTFIVVSGDIFDSVIF